MKVDNLEALKERIHRDLVRQLEEKTRDKAVNQYLEKLAAEINLAIPESMVKEEAQAIIERQFRQEALKKIPSELWPGLMEQARTQAEASLKNHILLRKIAAREGLEITAEEFEQELKKVSETRNIPLDQLRAALARDGRDEDWKLNLLLRKTVDLLTGRIIIE